MARGNKSGSHFTQTLTIKLNGYREGVNQLSDICSIICMFMSVPHPIEQTFITKDKQLLCKKSINFHKKQNFL